MTTTIGGRFPYPAPPAPSPHTTGEERIRELSTDLDDALTAMSEAGTSAGRPEADLRKLLADIDGQYRRLYVRATKRDASPAPRSSGTPGHRAGWLAERLARAALNGNGAAARDLAEVLLRSIAEPVSGATTDGRACCISAFVTGGTLHDHKCAPVSGTTESAAPDACWKCGAPGRAVWTACDYCGAPPAAPTSPATPTTEPTPCLCGWLNGGVPDSRLVRHSPTECLTASAARDRDAHPSAPRPGDATTTPNHEDKE